MVSLTSLSEEERRRLLQQQLASGIPTQITPASVQGSLLGTPDLPGIFPTPSPPVSPTLGAIPSAVEPSVAPAVNALSTRSIDPSVIPTPEIPVIPSGGGLSRDAQGRLQALRNKWGGYMDAHAFATGTQSRRKSFDSGLGSVFGTAKDEFQTIEQGEWKFTYHRNPQTGEWTVIAAAPRWEPKPWPLTKDINNRPIFAAGPNAGRLLSDVAGLPKVQKEYAPTGTTKDFEYSGNLLSIAAKARQEFGEESEEYKNAIGEYYRWVSQSAKPTEDIKEYEYLQDLMTEEDNAKVINGENSPEHLAAKANVARFSEQIATGTGGKRGDEIRMFYKTDPAEGEEQQVVGFIDYSGDTPVFRDMDANKLTGVIPIPKAEITTTQQDFIQSLSTVKTAKGQAAIGELDVQVELNNYTRLLTDLEEYGKGASGLRGMLTEKVGGLLGQLNPYLEESFSQFIGGITADQAADYKDRLRKAVIDLIPVYTKEESKRITREERELTAENSRLTVATASITQIRRALKNALELRLLAQMRHRLIVSKEPRYDLSTDEGINELGVLLARAGYSKQQRVTVVIRFMEIQKEMMQTYLVKKSATRKRK